jgi:hypothetical protein
MADRMGQMTISRDDGILHYQPELSYGPRQSELGASPFSE